MKYIYKGEEYHTDILKGDYDTLDLLIDLEEDGEIESQTTTVYNVKNCDGYYEDNEIDDFLENLADMGIIEKVEEE